jgi:predicted enzyme related to lactoylglutathione lyase
MHEHIQGLGWFVRRSPDPHRLAAFYHDTLRFPILRSSRDSISLWTGETSVLEITAGGRAGASYANRNEATCYPVYRCYQFESVFERVRASGVRIIGGPATRDEFRPRSLAYFLDPDGHVTGLHQRPDTSTRPEDHEAWRLHELGEPRLPGVDPMPEDLQSIIFISLRSDDFDSQWRYFQDVVGLIVAHGPTVAHDFEHIPNSPFSAGVLTLGETIMLNIALSEVNAPVPADPAEVDNFLVLRVHGLSELVETLEGRGVRFLKRPTETDGGRIAYFVDPKGHLIGLQERDPDSDRPEDRLAEQRWAKRNAVA